MQTNTIQLDDTQIFAQTEGASDAPWLVFINSLLTDHRVWDAQVAALAGRYRILRYDQRGHGRSAAPQQALTFDQLGDDLIALMAQFDIPKAWLIGLSLGVPTALDVASKRPDMVAGLVLCDGQARSTPEGAALWENRISMAEERGMSAVASESFGRWFAPEFIRCHPAMAQQILAMMADTSQVGYVGCVRALQSFDYSATLPRLTCPVRLLAGARDGALPGVMRAMAAQIQGARMEEVPGAGHIPCVEQSEAFNLLLQRGFQSA